MKIVQRSVKSQGTFSILMSGRPVADLIYLLKISSVVLHRLESGYRLILEFQLPVTDLLFGV